MKRILAIIITLTISWTAFFIAGSEAFASGQLVETKPTLSNLPTSQQSSYKLYKDIFDELVDSIDASTRQLQQIYTLNRLYYFSLMLDNSLNCSSSISSGNNFNNDYLWFYFDYLMSHYNWSDDGSVGFFTIANEDGIITNVEELKFNTEKLGFFPSNWNGRNILWDLSDPPSYFIKFKSYYNYLYSSYLSDKSPSYTDSTNFAPTIISSSDFNNHINNTTTLTTSLPTTLVSWKHNPLSGSAYDEKRMNWYFAFMVDGDYFGIKDCKDVYALPFLTIDGVTYYYDTLYQLYYLDDITSDKFPGTDFSGSYYGPACSSFSSYDSTSDKVDTFYFRGNMGSYPIWYNDDMAKYKYSVISPSGYGKLEFFKKESYFSAQFSGISSSFGNSPFNKTSSSLSYISSSDSTNKISFSDFWYGNTNSGIIAHTEVFDYTVKNQPLSVNDVADDFGFLVCSKRFEIGFLSSYLDGSRIPQNSYVTISGDSIYDYSITNGDTGDTTNMGDFINNGYAWLNTGSGTQINPGGNGSGGGVGGNVNVSGSIDVGGSVDINVNVNGGNSSGNGTSYDLDTDPINKYLDGALEESGGVRQFLKTFFDFLPAEILGLLGLLITVVIICRILKR